MAARHLKLPPAMRTKFSVGMTLASMGPELSFGEILGVDSGRNGWFGKRDPGSPPSQVLDSQSPLRPGSHHDDQRVR